MRANLLGGISDMTLHRWLNNPALGFPRPIKINNLRYWRVADVLAWLESREVAA
ncbi:helix-turn-helix transcriptional regulator [Paracoccus denitrificans]|uniref:helix-turn-helix transcriptional regulator n=1 Tax=Paracoccus denitrificans TaxID=266 RepID=UPI00336520FD